MNTPIYYHETSIKRYFHPVFNVANGHLILFCAVIIKAFSIYGSKYFLQKSVSYFFWKKLVSDFQIDSISLNFKSSVIYGNNFG